MDSEEESAITVYRPHFQPMKSTEFDMGLYYDATELTTDPPGQSTTPTCCLLNTVVENLCMFTQQEILRANDALALHRKCGRPCPRDFAHAYYAIISYLTVRSQLMTGSVHNFYTDPTLPR
mmetsp:Transcript_17522/g.26813  ORF Transcript_17522/g.26813 Transcript_17522/m.26813 type:complete len:121 (-) Transcript_17522:2820-3182(-)|eukprot:CAMPEP_0118707130 /NCGR_PEP_ID=MMETSP0800-20121206/21001_1 /TAXON_ID=210618 ORGANISM="Striatella unipunctata, Strain CCMP2910" /NCGR_SAMPLE_ID=MMETSP0800 /ASSEMBLY_ACC=CAM_ASM_000638 /LENGTH=120 /DNA_ID=CAMNT_0006609859 /DNA_START=797 /DNA_END=1159 /DNA_ORIENTATION=+